MDKIKINLLPPEIKEKAKKVAKRSFVNKISIILLGVLILATSGILAVVIFQGATVNSLNSDIEREQARIQSKRDAEAVVRLFKNRTDTINLFATKRYKQREVYDLITNLFPSAIRMQSIQIGKTKKVSIMGQTDNTSALQDLFNRLTDPKINEGKITSVTVENLNKSQLGNINFELSINLAEGVL